MDLSLGAWRDFSNMTNLSKDYRALLANRFVVALPVVGKPTGE